VGTRKGVRPERPLTNVLKSFAELFVDSPLLLAIFESADDSICGSSFKVFQ
jgi:hypothetical protein